MRYGIEDHNSRFNVFIQAKTFVYYAKLTGNLLFEASPKMDQHAKGKWLTRCTKHKGKITAFEESYFK